METQTRLPRKTEPNSTTTTASVSSLPTLFGDFRREIDRLFDDFAAGHWLRPFHTMDQRLSIAPAVDLVEKDTAFVLTAELPGMTGKDVDVSLRNGSLVIKGEKEETTEEKADAYVVKERRHGSFERAFALPEGLDRSAIEAAFRDGVLVVTLPKTTDAQKPAKKIEVKAG